MVTYHFYFINLDAKCCPKAVHVMEINNSYKLAIVKKLLEKSDFLYSLSWRVKALQLLQK